MYEYDPHAKPDITDWNSLEDEEKLEIIRQYHECYDPDLPDVELHSLFHSIIENQVALGEEIPVASTLDRLMSEGLNRHDAIHAIGSVLAEYVFDIMKGSGANSGSQQYYSALEQLTAESWLSQDGGAA